jgi:hypothetical protein
VGKSRKSTNSTAKSIAIESHPFPEGLTPNIPAKRYAIDACPVAISKAARRLNDCAWLIPPDLVRIEPEVVPRLPGRTASVPVRAGSNVGPGVGHA